MDKHHSMRNFLFRLDPIISGLSLADLEVKTLGKLEIKWRRRFGDMGRLQTQQIQGLKLDRAEPFDVVGSILAFQPERVMVYHPFDVVIRLWNCTDDPIGACILKLSSEPF